MNQIAMCQERVIISLILSLPRQVPASSVATIAEPNFWNQMRLLCSSASMCASQPMIQLSLTQIIDFHMVYRIDVNFSSELPPRSCYLPFTFHDGFWGCLLFCGKRHATPSLSTTKTPADVHSPFLFVFTTLIPTLLCVSPFLLLLVLPASSAATLHSCSGLHACCSLSFCVQPQRTHPGFLHYLEGTFCAIQKKNQ